MLLTTKARREAEGAGARWVVVGAPPSGRYGARSGGVVGLGVASPPDGTSNHSTKPASGQVAGKPQPSLAAAMVRCSPPPQPSPLKGEGVSFEIGAWRAAFVGAPPSGRYAGRSCNVAGSGVAAPPDGTPNQSTKPASGQVAGKPQPSHPQGVRRWVPRCFAATLPQPLKGEGASVPLCLRVSCLSPI
jgi:hypothetical protein